MREGSAEGRGTAKGLNHGSAGMKETIYMRYHTDGVSITAKLYNAYPAKGHNSSTEVECYLEMHMDVSLSDPTERSRSSPLSTD